MTQQAHQAAKAIINQRPEFKAKVGVILGSGLGAFADAIEDALVIPYRDIPGFPVSSVQGHKGNLVIGTLKGLPVACLQGRLHYYEGVDNNDIKTLIRTLKLLGCESLFITNIVGSLRKEVVPGDLVVIRDHLNLQGRSPLVGHNDDDFGPRFPSMESTYDEELRQRIHHAGKAVGLQMTEGVYAGLLGPQFETPAEIEMIRRLGGDVVGMSTVPDVIVARHCGMRVATVSVISNMACGMSNEDLTHEDALEVASKASENLIALMLKYFEDYDAKPNLSSAAGLHSA